jgi:NAD(P) transhydrogenase subunit alpha
MKVACLKEAAAGERRVALVPNVVAALSKLGLEVVVETGAGVSAGYPDRAFADANAKVVSRQEALEADIVVTVRFLGAAPEVADPLRAGQVWIGHADPLSHPAVIQRAAASGATAFGLELIPRITRAQAMDVLSSQANLAGYKAVLLGAAELPKVLPMMTTAAGTIPPAKALVLGIGVAGLQAIATAKRLGAVVTGYDVRPETRTQVESLGARFLDLGLEAEQGEGGYAKEQSAEFLARQQEAMTDAMAEMDLIVTTAAVPGRKAPILVTEAQVARMRPGSVIVDLAAERGGNCALTRPGETVEIGGVRILGPVNLPSTLAYHASALYAKNVQSFLANLIKDKALNVNLEDPIISDTLLFRDGELTNARVKEALA